MPETTPARQIGGMALANGLLVHGSTHWAAAVQSSDGTVSVMSGRKVRFARGPAANLPIVRGVLRLAEAFTVLPSVKRAMPEARFAMEDAGTGVALIASAAIAAGVRRTVRWPMLQETAGAAAGLAPMLLALRASSAAVWHGVEHKSIAAYESGGSAGIHRAAEHAKEHPRCGSNLVVPLLVTSAVANAVSRVMFRRQGPITRAVVGAASVGAAVEVFAFSGRMPNHPIARAVHGAGRMIQAGFATREPGAAELEVGKAAMDALLEAERATPA
jgi:uncharacterized protein YqhQ